MNNGNIIGTLRDLVSINSVNPAYDPGSSECEIQNYVEQFFTSRGISACRQEVLPGRFNVVARVSGRDRSRRLIFEAHTDTAGIDGMVIPAFEPRVEAGRLYGRGSCDTKAGLAAMMHALADLHDSRQQPPCDVWVAASVDEEHSCQGVLKLCENLQATAAVVSEPTSLKLAVASKGCVRWRVTVRGRAAHSSRPELGVNAILQMAQLLVELSSDGVLSRGPEHRLVGNPTLNVGTIHGGTQVNIVPELCSISIDRRLVPGEDPETVLRACGSLLDHLRSSRGLDVEMEPLIEDWPLETPIESPIASRMAEVLREAGLDSRPTGVPFGSDASKFARAGIPAVILGPGSIDQAHTASEYVDLEQVEQAFQVYRRLMSVFE